MPTISSKDQNEFHCSVEAKTETHAVLELYGTVGGDFFGEGLSAKQVVDSLKKLPPSIKTLDLRINSPGGSVFEGMAIMHRIKAYGQKVKVTAYIDALSASIASVIMLAADKIVMGDGAFVMVHRPMTSVYGNADEMEKAIAILDDIENQMVTMYAKKTGLSRLEIKDLLKQETWMDADEAIRLGFADERLESDFRVAACLNPELKWLKNLPEKLTTKSALAKQAVGDLEGKITQFLARK